MLSDQWFTAAWATFIVLAITTGAGFIPKAGGVVAILLLPLTYSFTVLFLKAIRGEVITIPPLFDGFKDYGRILGTVLLQRVYIFLWSFLFFVPGIIKYCSYAMTPYILLDEPELKYNAAIEKSMAMMAGHKMKLFLLELSFIGWFLLTLLTGGIGLLFLYPYIDAARAAFYEDLKNSTETLD